jgi:hypothetical protein
MSGEPFAPFIGAPDREDRSTGFRAAQRARIRPLAESCSRRADLAAALRRVTSRTTSDLREVRRVLPLAPSRTTGKRARRLTRFLRWRPGNGSRSDAGRDALQGDHLFSLRLHARNGAANARHFERFERTGRVCDACCSSTLCSH